jgi:hypothetical protein
MSKIALYATIAHSFQEAQWHANDALKIQISEETVRQVTEKVGEIIFNRDLEIAKNPHGIKNNVEHREIEKGDILYFMVDGSFIHTHEKDENTLAKWKENKLGIIFSSKDMKLKSEKTEKFNYDILKKEFVDYLGSVDTLQDLLYSAAIRHGYEKYKRVIFISDGAVWIKNMRENLFPNAMHIIDFWHLTQHIYEFAKIYFRGNDKKCPEWAEKIKGYMVYSEHTKALD